MKEGWGGGGNSPTAPSQKRIVLPPWGRCFPDARHLRSAAGGRLPTSWNQLAVFLFSAAWLSPPSGALAAAADVANSAALSLCMFSLGKCSPNGCYAPLDCQPHPCVSAFTFCTGPGRPVPALPEGPAKPPPPPRQLKTRSVPAPASAFPEQNVLHALFGSTAHCPLLEHIQTREHKRNAYYVVTLAKTCNVSHADW